MCKLICFLHERVVVRDQHAWGFFLGARATRRRRSVAEGARIGKYVDRAYSCDGRRYNLTRVWGTGGMDFAGFWTAEMLLERQNANDTGLIKPFDPQQLERISYRLSVGEEIFISPTSEHDIQTKQILKDRSSRVIPPGQFALLTTQEEVIVPDDAIAFIFLRSKATKFKGLVNVSGFYVEPGYRGVLIFTVFNAGPAPIHVAMGDRWFEIFYASLGRPSRKRRDKDYFHDLPTELITPLSHAFLSLPGLDAKIDNQTAEFEKRLQSMEREQAISRWALGLAVSLLIGLGVHACSVDGAHAEDPRPAAEVNQ